MEPKQLTVTEEQLNNIIAQRIDSQLQEVFWNRVFILQSKVNQLSQDNQKLYGVIEQLRNAKAKEEEPKED